MVLDLLMSDLIGNTVAPVLTSAMHVCIADARSAKRRTSACRIACSARNIPMHVPIHNNY